MNIDAQIRPLSGKYYGTIIDYGPRGNSRSIELWDNNWDNGLNRPSDRWLEWHGFYSWEYYQELPDEYVVVDPDYPDDYEYTMDKTDIWCDNHYESQGTYLMAQRIVEALND